MTHPGASEGPTSALAAALLASAPAWEAPAPRASAGVVPEARAGEEVVLAEAVRSAPLEAAEVGLQLRGVRGLLPIAPGVSGVSRVIKVGPAVPAGRPAVLVEEGLGFCVAGLAAGTAPEASITVGV